MAQTINVKSTVAQADAFAVEVEDSTLLSTRYFVNGAGDNFVGKEVLFDFDSSDLEKGAFLTTQYQNGSTVNWIANSVVPPRVATADTVDPKTLDRQLFERLCRAQGADLNRAQAFQDLLSLKAARLARRTDRAIELLAALVLSEGKIEFDQPRTTAEGAETDHIQVKFYDPSKGASNHFAAAYAWGTSQAKPYDDLCRMITEGMKHGRRYTDLVLGANAWANLSKDDKFLKFAGNTFHSDGMVIDFGEIDGAQHVAKAVFNGVQLNVIVYSGAYRNNGGELVTYISPNAAILLSEGVGRLLCGGCTLLADNVNYDLNTSFVDVIGKHCVSLYKDFNSQELTIREESRPLPAPRISVNELPWIYCDTSLSAGSFSGVGEYYKGIKFNEDDSLTWATHFSSGSLTVVNSGREITITPGAVTSKTVKLYAVRDGKAAEEITISSNKIVIPVDADVDSAGKVILYATAV